MRSFFVSDLHKGSHPSGDRAIAALAARLERESRPDDVLVAVGDLAIDDQGIADCLSLFRGFRGLRLAVAGNHDVWVPHGGNSFKRYLGLADVFRASGFHPLETEPVRHRGTAFVGSMGWYDYSFADRIGIGEEAYRTKVYPGEEVPAWNDARYVRWRFSDKEMTDMMVTRLDRHLDFVGDAERVVVAIHHVPTKRHLVHPRFVVPRRWRFANAFLGSERFRETIEKHENVRLVVNGHIHREHTTRIRGVTYASIGGGYEAKQLLATDTTRVVRAEFAA